jgi:hypothetical protein
MGGLDPLLHTAPRDSWCAGRGTEGKKKRPQNFGIVTFSPLSGMFPLFSSRTDKGDEKNSRFFSRNRPICRSLNPSSWFNVPGLKHKKKKRGKKMG